jgi:uncharacterized protein (PEP-CTERM system associated)
MALRTRPRPQRLPVNITAGIAGRWLVLPAWLILAAVPSWSQEGDAGGARFWSFEPSLSIRQVVTTNYRLSTPRDGDAITELGAGLRVAAQGSNLQGSLDYRLTGLVYSRHAEENTARHQLSANGKAELVNGQAYVDMGAAVSEQTVSAFGALSTDGLRPNTNSDRVYSFSVSPYVVGRVSNLFDYEARLRQETTRFKESAGLGYDRTAMGFDLFGDGVPVGWRLGGNYSRSRYQGDDFRNDTNLDATLLYQVNQDLRFGASVGVESSELADRPIDGRTTYGLSADWTPSGRTALRLSTTKHYYGNAHGLELTHRFERLVLTFSDRRDLSNGSVQGVPTAGALNQLLTQQFVGGTTPSSQTDFAARDFLRANGVDPNAQIISGFVTNAASIARTQALSAIWRGLRTTLAVRLAQSWTRQLEGLSGPVTDFQFSRILRQRGIVGDLSYNPSPVSTVGLTGTWQRNSGDVPAPTTELKSLGLNWSTRPSVRSQWSVGLRHTVFNSPTDPYQETSGYLGYRLQF